MSNTKNVDAQLDAMLKQYANSSNSTKNGPAKEYDLKNYFTTHIGDKDQTVNKRIRILPTKDNSSAFVEVYGHKVQVEGEWKTFTCLKHENNEDCPFCEAYDALRATGVDAQKELAKKYSARKMYVVKIIDRDNESHGVKFWRFNHDYRKQGVLDKIYGVLQAVGNSTTDPETGRDLLITIARDQNKKPAITTINHVDSTPLSTDKAQAAEWLADDRTWKDVYAIKPYEYLEIIVKGGVPAWDKNEKKFVDKVSLKDKEKADSQEEITLGTPNVKSNITAAAKTALPTVAVGEDTELDTDDDMPF